MSEEKTLKQTLDYLVKSKIANKDTMIFLNYVGKEVDKEKDEITFTDSEGVKYLMYHEQDCCEEVNIEDICGDINNLLNTP